MTEGQGKETFYSKKGEELKKGVGDSLAVNFNAKIPVLIEIVRKNLRVEMERKRRLISVNMEVQTSDA